MYRALLARVTTFPLFPSSSKSVSFPPVFGLLAHSRVIMIRCIWTLKCENEKKSVADTEVLLSFSFFFFPMSFLFQITCWNWWFRKHETHQKADSESMKHPILGLNTLANSLAQNSLNCFVCDFQRTVFFISSQILWWGNLSCTDTLWFSSSD